VVLWLSINIPGPCTPRAIIRLPESRGAAVDLVRRRFPRAPRLVSNGGVDPFEAVDALYQRYGAVVYRRARALLGDEDRAWDVTHEIFMQMMGGGATAFRQESSPTTWLYRVTTNRCLNILRDSRRRARRLEVNFPALSLPAAQEGAPPLDARIAIRQLAQHMEPALCELAVYAYVDGLTQEEIGQMVGLSRKTVGQRLQQFCERAATLFDQPRKVTA
jgi:RNA polymerase sigma-70 factor (ECF subfamily)